MSKTTKPIYVVANPRELPAGKWIVKVEGRLYFEGDTFEGEPPERFIEQGFVETPEQRDARLAVAAEAKVATEEAERAGPAAKAARLAEQRATEKRLAREAAARQRANERDVAERARRKAEEAMNG